MRYEIVAAAPVHVGPIANNLGEEGRIIAAHGGRPRGWLRWQIQNSSDAWTALIDGTPGAMWGVFGSALEPERKVWAAITDIVRPYRLTMVRGALAWLEYMSATSRLVSQVRASDRRARRFAECVGFKVWEDEPVLDSGVVCFPITMEAAHDRI